jgi:hypothetical protein
MAETLRISYSLVMCCPFCYFFYVIRYDDIVVRERFSFEVTTELIQE